MTGVPEWSLEPEQEGGTCLKAVAEDDGSLSLVGIGGLVQQPNVYSNIEFEQHG